MGEEELSSDASPSQVSQSRESTRRGKVCGVCGDQALGYNFNAVTCESCKAFFRRNALRNKEFRCPFSDACEITSVTRRFCQRCRLRKCFTIGMRKDWILSEEDKRLKREKVENNKAAARKRSRSGSTSTSEKGVSSPSVAIITSEATSDSSQLPPSSSSPTPNSTQPTKPQAWVTGTPKAKVPKLDSTEEPIPSLPRSSPVSVITSQNSLIPQTPTNQPTLPQSAALPQIEEIPSTSFEAQSNEHSATLPSSSAVHQESHSPIEQPNAPLPASVPLQPSPIATFTPNTVATVPRSTPLLNSLVNQNSEDPSNAFYSRTKSSDAIEEGVSLRNKNRKTSENEMDENSMSRMVSVKAESQSSDWWSANENREVIVQSAMGSASLESGSLESDDLDKEESRDMVTTRDDDEYGRVEKVADDTISQLAPITLDDDWDYHGSLSRRAPIAPDSIGSILSEAIKIEFEALGPLHCSIRGGGGDSGCGGSGSYQRYLNEAERAKLNELVVANQALLAPLDADLSAPLDTSVCGGGEPPLLDIINLTAVAIRRLIKMSKRIGAFKSLCQEDQVALLKGGCTEMMILRSVMTYDPDKDSWKIPHSGTSRSRGSPNLIKVDVLKKAPGNVYEEHQRFLRTFDARWRSDENVMLLLSAITLFSPQRTHVVHADVVRLEQNSYYYLLRRYLENVCPNGCEARSTFLHLIQKMAELHRLNEEHVKVYLDVNPRDVEPLLIEIFDLKPH